MSSFFTLKCLCHFFLQRRSFFFYAIHISSMSVPGSSTWNTNWRHPLVRDPPPSKVEFLLIFPCDSQAPLTLWCGGGASTHLCFGHRGVATVTPESQFPISEQIWKNSISFKVRQSCFVKKPELGILWDCSVNLSSGILQNTESEQQQAKEQSPERRRTWGREVQ